MQRRNEKGQFCPCKAEKFSITKKSGEVELLHTNGLVARYEVERSGQELPTKSNKVVVKATLLLDSAKDTSLSDEICFGFDVFGESLYSYWGRGLSLTNDDRAKTKTFSGVRFRELFREAEEYCLSEIRKINEALEVRHQALLDADY